MSFPTTPILDNFNRANEGPPPSASWTLDAPRSGSASAEVVSNQCGDSGGGEGGCWGTQFGPDVEMYMTVATLPNATQAQLYVRLNPKGAAVTTGYQVTFLRNDPNSSFAFYRWDSGAQTQIGSFTDPSGTWADGYKIGVSMIGSVLSAYIDKGSGWTFMASASDGTYTAAGYIGFRNNSTTQVYDDFGGGTVAVADTSVHARPVGKSLR